MPGARVLFAGVTVIDCRAATAVVFAVAELLALFGSVAGEFAEAVLVMMVPPAVVAPSFTTSEMLTVAPGATVPTLHVTGVGPEHDPADGVAAPDGRVAGPPSA